jgi:hypothetical protein
VPVGTYTYTVVAVFHSWTSSSTPSASVTVAKADQAITITSTPVTPTYGGTYDVVADGGGSGNPIVFGTLTPAVCSVSGSTVSFDHAGDCTVTADQDGSTYFNAAPQATQLINIAKASQTITFTTTAPTDAVVADTGYTPAATGGGSGNPVTLSIDAASASVCSISGGVVTYQHVGTCVVDADQAGTDDYATASRVQQSIAVGQGSQAVEFTSTMPTDAKVNGTYTVTASGTASGIPVTITSATPSVCTISGSTVSFVGAGMCTIDADQAGNEDYLAATTVHQTFTVAKNAQTITFTSTAPTDAKVGGSYTAIATATSGLTVTFGTDTTSVCTVSSTGSVSFMAAGTCHVNADQAGDFAYDAAAQQQQSFAVGGAGPVITSCTRNVTSGEITVVWSSFGGAISYKLSLTSGTVSPVTSPYTTTTIGKNHSGSVSVVAVTASGDVQGPAWVYDGSGANQACHQ